MLERGLTCCLLDVCHALDLSSTCTALQTLHLYFTVYGEEISSIPATERGWLPSCFRASADLLTTLCRRALPALWRGRITIDADHDGRSALRSLKLAGQDVRAAWRPPGDCSHGDQDPRTFGGHRPGLRR
ncbi:hypothetical protein OH76DRAFT_1022135 [Lentinus brumalis]|uniref:Uncharacterized protein n=1 Tax=Lentinus brumalis TaxID=2498619 RepID=A0A371CXY1_9APHY|nr:hypothetical protein OH76DRAFT_1022135 [Polyporus brumalis]